MIPGSWKRRWQALPFVDRLWGSYRRRQLHRAYRARRDDYARQADRLLASQPDFSPFRPELVAAQVRQRLAARGWHPRVGQLGDLHTFAFVPRISWHAALYPDLAELGPVSEYDYARHGFRWEMFARGDRNASLRRREMLSQFRAAIQQAHRARPIDWVFVYASGVDITAEALRWVTDELGVPVVNMCLDDKQSWTGPVFDGCRLGQIDLAPVVDLSWTSARVACEWYLAEGGRPIYLPEGFDAASCFPLELPRDIPVSFVGGAYGFRRELIRDLRRAGIPVEVFGAGWGSRHLSSREMLEVVNRSVINLGSGGIGYSEELTNVKGRDFEVPGTGGGLYLTTFNADLARHFEIGREIACYHSREELIEQLRYYLRHPDEAAGMARRARERSLREHRWLHRYLTVCRLLGVLAEPALAHPVAA